MKKYTLLILFIFTGLFSCKNQTDTSKKEEITDSTQTNSTTKEETEKVEETDFDTFFEKYPSDSVFQINHTKFPLKCITMELEEDEITFIQKNKWQFNDFEDNKTSEYDQYEYQKKVINSNLVLYKMQGIDNGISVVYKFIFDNQEWNLEEIENASH